MKHILNNLTEEEKNSIREQHTGGMKVMTDKFNKLLESKLGDVKPILSEQLKPAGPAPVATKQPSATKQPKPTGPAPVITKPEHPVNAKKIQLIQIKVGDRLVDLNMMQQTPQGATFYGLVRGNTKQYHQLLFNCGSRNVVMGIMNTAGTGGKSMISSEAMALLNKASGCNSYVKNQDTSSDMV